MRWHQSSFIFGTCCFNLQHIGLLEDFLKLCCSSGFWLRIDSSVDANVSEKLTVSIFRAEDIRHYRNLKIKNREDALQFCTHVSQMFYLRFCLLHYNYYYYSLRRYRPIVITTNVICPVKVDGYEPFLCWTVIQFIATSLQVAFRAQHL
jgi:hypothetical protein